MRIALYEPDIPQNTGAVLRTAACFGIGVDIIEPCGFVWDEKRLRRAGMDYLDSVDMVRHASWQKYLEQRQANQESGRMVLLTTKGSVSYAAFTFQSGDTILLGRESAGVPDSVHDSADARIRIPMAAGMRSLNVAVSAGVVMSEALRQLNAYPQEETKE
ncbi:MAG: tRNA (cytidine(34)-2'-O)-methyltransferase [Rhodospirillales bacterium]|nr:tRNA (cytidine(34)-2'-O)-methyltransferase [Rhodospirillales bacterium]